MARRKYDDPKHRETPESVTRNIGPHIDPGPRRKDRFSRADFFRDLHKVTERATPPDQED